MATKKISFVAAAFKKTKNAIDAVKISLAERKLDLVLDTKLNQIDIDLLTLEGKQAELLVDIAKGDETKINALVANFREVDSSKTARDFLVKIKTTLTSQVDVADDDLA